VLHQEKHKFIQIIMIAEFCYKIPLNNPNRTLLSCKPIDMHHGNYNPSCKAKTNVQEDSDGPMTRARAKQLQRALTSQIGMIEAASELKISNQFEIGSRMFICLQLELGDEKSP
jgi:hypothetical protein